MTHNLNLDNEWWFNSESTLEIFIGHTILESKLVNISRFFDNGYGICSEIFASRFLPNLFGWFHTRTRLVANISFWVFISRSSYQSVTGTDIRYECSYFRKFRTDRKFQLLSFSHLQLDISSASRTCLSQYYIHFHFKFIRWFQEDFKHLLCLRWCWWLKVGDDLWMLVTSFECWCPTLMEKDCGCWWLKRPKPSPTSWNGHQHIRLQYPSPTSL